MTHGELLSQWASLGRSIRVDPPAVDWTPALRMIAAAEKDAEESRNVLKGLFERSKAEHFPEFGDPLDLDLDFGAHRWLKGSREEAWSDWLAWILEFVLLLAVDEPDSLPSSRKNTTGRKHGSASEFRGVLARLGRCIFTSSAMMMNRPY